jgi:biopolymer transport protein ExbD
MHKARQLGLIVLFLSSSSGCDLLKKDKAQDSVSAATEAPRPLQDIELPVSLRTSDVLPGDARRLEASDQQLSLEGEVIASLAKGRVAKNEQVDGVIPKLEQKLQARASSTIALRFQANVPYETVALVMSTARKVGMSNAVIQVRPVGSSTNTGWLAIDGYVMSSKADDLPPITAVQAKSWNAFTDQWQATFDGCRTSPNANCAYVNDNIADGGTLKVELFASGRGINIDFFRRGLTPEQEAHEDKVRAQILARKKEDFLQGRISHDDMVEALLLGDPSTYALFQFRYQEALKKNSALSKTMAPVCHKDRCGVVLTADSITPLVNVVSMIGAAYPDGTQMPAFAIEMPWTERPKPAVLSEFIAQQMAK